MSKKSHQDPDIIGIINAGLILILIAVFLVFRPLLIPTGFNFILDLRWLEVSPGIFWWSPQTPGAHVYVYETMYLFFLGTIIISFIVLALRVVFRDNYDRQIEGIGSIIMSAGITWAAYNLFFNYTPITAFTVFSGWFIVFVGVSIIIQSFGHWVVSNYGKSTQ
ncbi:MAG: hypothetical protein ACFFCH_09790 [Promethearchaeota archaeon]